MPLRALLVGVGQAQDGLLPERLAQKLQADGQPRLRPGEAARQR